MKTSMWQQLMAKIYAVGWWLRSLPSRIAEGILEGVFAITKPAGKSRLWIRDLLFFLLIVVILIRHWDWVGTTGFRQIWQQVGGSWVAKLLGVLIFGVPRYVEKVVLVFFLPDSMRIWLPLILPYFLARYAASRYLEDIYEVSDALKDARAGLKVAQEFLLRAAFAHGYGRVREKRTGLCRLIGWVDPAFCPTMKECIKWELTQPEYCEKNVPKSLIQKLKCWERKRCSHVLSIVNGEIKDRQSPLLLIGGPGYVFISADSAALFERPDGMSWWLGPTIDRLHLIEGFERVRRIVNLREHQLTISASARSRDGLPIEVKDVQLLFDIYRGGRPADRKRPYPFMPMALDRLVYQEPAGPVADRWETLSSSRLLTDAMRTMARVELLKFIRSQNVEDFLFSVSYGDVEKLRLEYYRLAKEIAGEEGNVRPMLPSMREPADPIYLYSDIAARFNDMANGPDGKRARQRGVGLQWIGLGAWHTPVTRVIDQHKDVWRISIENKLRASPLVLARLRRERRISAVLEHVRTLLGLFQKTEEEKYPPSLRVIALLKDLISWMEQSALRRFNRLEAAPPAWQHTMTCLRSVLPRAVEPTEGRPEEDARDVEQTSPARDVDQAADHADNEDDHDTDDDGNDDISQGDPDDGLGTD